jgi:hypothetical protein
MLRLIALIALLATPALAHSPVLNLADKPKDAPFVIDEPEHSKAIFSELTGAAQYYQITSTEEFDFYVGLTAAKRDDCPLAQTFSFRVLDADFKEIDGRDGSKMEWVPWYEEFGKNWYWVGPEIGKAFAHDRTYAAGTYYVEVFNKANTGEYVLAVGDQERFGLGTLLTIRGTMREVQAKFWDEKGCE